ncbi:MAG: endolytic transglycosylase MltG [Chloroflexi bacterium]|nr:endolytic transglycosylase MltG [Chloroflexota bacterium]
MARFLRSIALFVLALGLIGVIGMGALFVFSGGQPVDFVQKAFIRLSLSSRQDELSRAISSDTTPVRFTVNPGDTPPVIARSLVDQGLIADAGLFVDYVRLYDFDRQLQAGTYFLSRALTIPDIAAALTDARSTQFAFRILEGWRMEEIAAAIDDSPYFPFSGADFLAAVGPGAAVDPVFAQQVGLPPGSSLEGFLYPDTYQLPAEVTPGWLRDFLTETFMERVGPQIPVDATAQGFNLYQIVTLAAIVEREAIHADEQPLIAGVYRNRLVAGMRLEADPTVQYPLGAPGSWWPRITAADYSGVFSPYNTYLNDGLPPGPIASPGITAIQAVVYPATSDYYYFRADCRSDGYHDFARTFQEHLANGC